MTDTAVNPLGFQIKPDLENILRADTVKEIIQKVLSDNLLDKTYSAENVKIWTKRISDDVNKSLCELKNSRYKHVVQVVIMEKTGQGFKMISRARWDSECDRQISDSFSNDTIICVVTVFGCYLY